MLNIHIYISIAFTVNKRRRQRCGICSGCRAKECGNCSACKDKPKFGGKGTRRQCCQQRRCKEIALKNSGGWP